MKKLTPSEAAAYVIESNERFVKAMSRVKLPVDDAKNNTIEFTHDPNWRETILKKHGTNTDRSV